MRDMRKAAGFFLIMCLLIHVSLKAQDNRVFKRKYISQTLLTAAKWQLEHPKHKLNDWTNGAFYAGVMAAYETTGSKELHQALVEMGEATGWKPGSRLHHADDHAICQTYIDLYRLEKDPKMIQPTVDTINKMMITPYPAKGIQQICWWWCDALFMAPPALVKLGITLEKPEYLAFSDRLFRETVDLLWNGEDSLFARDLNYVWEYTEQDVKEANGERVYWSRGNGWVMAGLARILQELPPGYPQRDYYLALFKKMAKRIASLQLPDGLWRASLLDPGAYPGGEASGSGFYCYALAWGINQGVLDRSTYLPVVRKAWAGLNSLLTPEGYVGWVQPIGADPQKDFSPSSWEVYGTGAFLLAGSEVMKLDGARDITWVTPARSVKTTLPAGIGNKNERMVAFRVMEESETESLKKIRINFFETSELKDLQNIKVYFNGSNERFDPVSASLLATVTRIKTEMTVRVDQPLASGENWFWITADISPDATEGHKIGATVTSCETGGGVTIPVLEPAGARVILLTSRLLFSCGDAGSKSYRIPAIVTAMDGSLVTATDKRWTGSTDLPNPIDVVIRRSTDKGHSWSEAVTIAGIGTDTGFGDPSLVVNRKNGDIICLFASDKGWYNSTPTEPQRINQCVSHDHGITWSEPRDITSQIYGAASSNPVTQNWQGAFVTSGAATQLRSGRLMAVLAVRENLVMEISDYVIYSDAGGQTWQVSTNRAFAKGDEAKVTQLDNGDVLMSIRQRGNRWFNISKDQGMTWGTPFMQKDIIDPFCNGDLISYTAVSDGYDKNRLLHSIPFATNRSNVSVLLSYDEGLTWPVRKTIYSGSSAYSALTILDDGTIGIYFEVGEYEVYQMYFMRFSLEWLTDGADQWTGQAGNPDNR